jgi:hypothetical protein
MLALKSIWLEDVMSPPERRITWYSPEYEDIQEGYIHPNRTLFRINKSAESWCCEKTAETRVMENSQTSGRTGPLIYELVEEKGHNYD